ncbi:MAG: ABC transporter permease [Candidatus Dormibacteria bacterium]
MHNLRKLLRQIQFEQRAFWRNPASAVFTFVFPVIILVVLGNVNSHAHFHVGAHTYSYDDYLAPSMSTYGIISATFVSLAMILSIRRDSGVLKRFQGTPLGSTMFIVSILISSLINVIIMMILTIGLGMISLGVHFPANALLTILIMLFGAVCFASLGVAMAALIPNSDAAPAIVNGIFFPIAFISGIFFPISGTTLLGRIGNIFPISHYATAVFDAYNPIGTAPSVAGSDLLILGVWGVIGILVAIRRFKWEPSRR